MVMILESQWLYTPKVYFSFLLHMKQESVQLCSTQALGDPGQQMPYHLTAAASGTSDPHG